MKIKLHRILPLISFILLFTNTVSAQYSTSQATRKLATAMAIIENTYVDTINTEKYSDEVISAMLSKLDPHSSFIPADELKEMNEPLEGNFDGIGVSFNMVTDTLYIIETISGGPSEKVGILPGDRIIMVDDTLIAGVKMPNRDIMKRLRGKKGTTVNVKVLRKGSPDLIDFKITRDKIPIYSLDASYMIDDKTGYISLSRFAATTTSEFREAVKKLQSEGMQNLIIDLQNNGGGYLSTATELSNDLLGKDKLIVYTEGVNQPRISDISKNIGLFENGKLVILVNESSASASEIVSGAVQDWDRGLIVGRRTFGKGLVQRPFNLPGGSAMRLTVARYYTPTGRSIQKPYTIGDKDSYENDLITRYNHGEMMTADSIHFPDSLKYRTLVNKRVVYGGGGIMPDYFVPMDTMSILHRQLIAKGIVLRTYLNEADNHRKDILKKYPTIEAYKENFEINDEVFENLLQKAKEEKVEIKEEEFNESKKLIALQLKAYIAQDLYDRSAFSRIINDENAIFQEGLRIISDDALYNKLLKPTEKK